MSSSRYVKNIAVGLLFIVVIIAVLSIMLSFPVPDTTYKIGPAYITETSNVTSPYTTTVTASHETVSTTAYPTTSTSVYTTTSPTTTTTIVTNTYTTTVPSFTTSISFNNVRYFEYKIRIQEVNGLDDVVITINGVAYSVSYNSNDEHVLFGAIFRCIRISLPVDLTVEYLNTRLYVRSVTNCNVILNSTATISSISTATYYNTVNTDPLQLIVVYTATFTSTVTSTVTFTTTTTTVYTVTETHTYTYTTTYSYETYSVYPTQYLVERGAVEVSNQIFIMFIGFALTIVAMLTVFRYFRIKV